MPDDQTRHFSSPVISQMVWFLLKPFFLVSYRYYFNLIVIFIPQYFWKNLGNLGLLGITAPGE